MNIGITVYITNNSYFPHNLETPNNEKGDCPQEAPTNVLSCSHSSKNVVTPALDPLKMNYLRRTRHISNYIFEQSEQHRQCI